MNEVVSYIELNNGETTFFYFPVLLATSLSYESHTSSCHGVICIDGPFLYLCFVLFIKAFIDWPCRNDFLLVFAGVAMYAEPNSYDFISLVLALTIIVGIIQLLFGLFKVGFIVKLIPHSVLNGYTSAVAIVIGMSQADYLLGMDISSYLQVHLQLVEMIKHINELNLYTVSIGIGSFEGLLTYLMDQLLLNQASLMSFE